MLFDMLIKIFVLIVVTSWSGLFLALTVNFLFAKYGLKYDQPFLRTRLTRAHFLAIKTIYYFYAGLLILFVMPKSHCLSEALVWGAGMGFLTESVVYLFCYASINHWLFRQTVLYTIIGTLLVSAMSGVMFVISPFIY